MSGMLTFVLIVVSIIIIIAVIMQPSKDGGLGGLASGGVTDSVFGAGRNEFLTKATWVLMGIFLIGSLTLAKMETSQRLAKESEINKKSAAEEMDLSKDSSKVEDGLKAATEDAAEKIEVQKTDVEKTDVEKTEVKKDAAADVKAVEEKAKEETPKVDSPATDK